MSRAREVVQALLAVLDEERTAIRLLDGPAVAEAAAAKAKLATELSALAETDLVDVRDDVPRLRAELRRNGTLLAHARSCLRDVLEVAKAQRGLPRTGPQLRARL